MNHTGICWLPQSLFKCFKIALISASPPAVPTASDMFTWPVGQFQWLSFGFSHQSMYLDQNTGHLYGPIVIWTWSRVLFVTWNLHTLVLTGIHGSSSDLMINIMTKIFPLPQYTFTLKNDCGALWERFEKIFNKHASITGRSSLGKTLQQVGFRMAQIWKPGERSWFPTAVMEFIRFWYVEKFFVGCPSISSLGIPWIISYCNNSRSFKAFLFPVQPYCLWQ